MTCPKCHAKLLQVQTEYFCLQCGEAVPLGSNPDGISPRLEEAQDPLLRRAITDVANSPVVFEEAVPAANQVPETARNVSDAPKPQLDIAPRHLAHAGRHHAPRAVVAKPPKQPVFEVIAVADQLKRAHTGWRHWMSQRRLLYGLMTVAVFMIVNLAVGVYYAQRIYPGVRVGDINLSGRSWGAVEAAITAGLPNQPIHLVVGSTSYTLTPQEVGATYNLNTIRQQVERQGHSYLPLWGVVTTFWSQPIAVDYQVDERVFGQRLADLANEQSHAASDAQPVIVAGTAVVLSDKAGQLLDVAKLRAGALTALKSHDNVVITTTNISPSVSAEAFASDISQANAILGATITLKIKTQSVAISRAQIGAWLHFGNPGSGVSVDNAAISGYVNSLGTGFDRAAAAATIASDLTSAKSVAYTASVRRFTTAPSGVVTPATIKSYRYCISVSGASQDKANELAGTAKSVYAMVGGWSLTGLVKLEPAATSCNFTLWLAAADNMPHFSPACGSHSTCRVDNNLVINLSNWDQAPASWQGTQDEYRTELINHETGHWLGFDHLSCGGNTTAPIQDVVVQVSGCSPRWFPIAANLQPVKILPGF